MEPKMCSLIYSIFYLFFIGFRDFRFATILVVFGKVGRSLCNACDFPLQHRHTDFGLFLYRLFCWCKGLLPGRFCKSEFGIFGTSNLCFLYLCFSCAIFLWWLAFALADKCRCFLLYYK